MCVGAKPSFPCHLSACREAWKRLLSQNLFLPRLHTPLWIIRLTVLLYQQQVTQQTRDEAYFRCHSQNAALRVNNISQSWQTEDTEGGSSLTEMCFLCVKMRFQKFHQLIVGFFWSLIVSRGIAVGVCTWKKMFLLFPAAEKLAKCLRSRCCDVSYCVADGLRQTKRSKTACALTLFQH